MADMIHDCVEVMRTQGLELAVNLKEKIHLGAQKKLYYVRVTVYMQKNISLPYCKGNINNDN